MTQTKLCTVPDCTYPVGECSGACYHPDERRMDIIGQNGNDGAHYEDKIFWPSKSPLPEMPTSLPTPLPTPDVVNHPPHYTQHPSGVECITVTEHMGFCLGNAVKYIWRADLKNDAVEDLRKAVWYIEREIARRTK